MDAQELETVRGFLTGQNASVTLAPRSTVLAAQACREFGGALFSFLEAKARGRLSPFVALPVEVRDAASFFLGVFVRQVADATAAGEETVILRFDIDPAMAAGFAMSLKAMANFYAAAYEAAGMPAPPSVQTVRLFDEIASEIAAHAGERVLGQYLARPLPVFEHQPETADETSVPEAWAEAAASDEAE